MIYRCCDTHTSSTDIIDDCFAIFSRSDLISILPYETCIPLSVGWLHFASKTFTKSEDLLLWSENQWILRRKGFIDFWKFHDERSRCRDFFSSESITYSDFYSICIVTIIRSELYRYPDNPVSLTIDRPTSFSILLKWRLIITSPKTISPIIRCVIITPIYSIGEWSIFDLRTIIVFCFYDTFDREIPLIHISIPGIVWIRITCFSESFYGIIFEIRALQIDTRGKCRILKYFNLEIRSSILYIFKRIIRDNTQSIGTKGSLFWNLIFKRDRSKFIWLKGRALHFSSKRITDNDIKYIFFRNEE